MSEQTIVRAMVEQRRLAHHGRYIIKLWRLTELQAWQLADEIRWIQREPKTSCELVEAMKSGQVHMLGHAVQVR